MSSFWQTGDGGGVVSVVYAITTWFFFLSTQRGRQESMKNVDCRGMQRPEANSS